MAILAAARIDALRTAVRAAYSAAADQPARKHAFPVGRRFAESLGYHAELLDRLPAVSVDAFAGVSDVGLFADIAPGGTVLDLGCGAGLDTIIASTRLGTSGFVVGIDFSAAMLRRASAAIAETRTRGAVCRADAERLPLPDSSIDVAVVNGIFNLNPARDAIFAELARVVRSGGAVYAAELVLLEARPSAMPATDADWFA